MPKTRLVSLLYRSKSPAKKVGMNGHFQANRASEPIGRLLYTHTILTSKMSLINQ